MLKTSSGGFRIKSDVCQQASFSEPEKYVISPMWTICPHLVLLVLCKILAWNKVCTDQLTLVSNISF